MFASGPKNHILETILIINASITTKKNLLYVVVSLDEVKRCLGNGNERNIYRHQPTVKPFRRPVSFSFFLRVYKTPEHFREHTHTPLHPHTHTLFFIFTCESTILLITKLETCRCNNFVTTHCRQIYIYIFNLFFFFF